MQYLKAAGLGACVFLFLTGMQAIGDLGKSVSLEEENSNTVVYIHSESDQAAMASKLERLEKLSSIREVLEVNLPTARIEEKRQIAEAILDASELYNVDIALVLAVIQVESSFNHQAVSHVGARGLMQVMPRTGMAISKEIKLQNFSENQLFDQRKNILLGTYYLKKLLNRYNSLDHALIAYNIGPTWLDNAIKNNINYPTRYANKVKTRMDRIQKNFFLESLSVE